MRFVDSMIAIHPEIAVFDGRSKVKLSNKPLHVVVSGHGDQGFLRFYPGALAIADDALNANSELYYATVGGIELLLLTDGDRFYRALNPVEFLPAPRTAGAPCIVDKHYVSLFRIAGKPKHELYTVSGFRNRNDDFKSIYDDHKLSGLEFEPVWAGEAYRCE